MEDYGWYSGDELGMVLNRGCLKDKCENQKCLVCVAKLPARQYWRTATTELDEVTEQIKNKKMSEGFIANYDGSNEK